MAPWAVHMCDVSPLVRPLVRPLVPEESGAQVPKKRCTKRHAHALAGALELNFCKLPYTHTYTLHILIKHALYSVTYFSVRAPYLSYMFVLFWEMSRNLLENLRETYGIEFPEMFVCTSDGILVQA